MGDRNWMIRMEQVGGDQVVSDPKGQIKKEWIDLSGELIMWMGTD